MSRVIFMVTITDQDVPLLRFSDWAEHESAITGAFAYFVNRVAAAH